MANRQAPSCGTRSWAGLRTTGTKRDLHRICNFVDAVLHLAARGVVKQDVLGVGGTDNLRAGQAVARRWSAWLRGDKLDGARMRFGEVEANGRQGAANARLFQRRRIASLTSRCRRAGRPPPCGLAPARGFAVAVACGKRERREALHACTCMGGDAAAGAHLHPAVTQHKSTQGR